MRKCKEMKEVNFVENFTQLMNPEALVNTGLVHSVVQLNKYGDRMIITVQMNSRATHYFVK